MLAKNVGLAMDLVVVEVRDKKQLIIHMLSQLWVV